MKEPIPIKRNGSWKYIQVQSGLEPQCLDLFHRGEIDGFALSPHAGFKGTDVSFLKDAPALKYLTIANNEHIDISPLPGLNNLRYLALHEIAQAVDLSDLERLEILRIDWHKKLILPASNCPIEELYLRSYRPQSKSLAELPAYPVLKKFELVLGNLESLDGIEALRSLEYAELSYLKQLKSINALGRTNIRTLFLDCCKKVKDYEALRACKNLKLLILNGQGDIPSLKLINDVPNLEELRFIKSTITDGDMTPLLNLKKAAFFKSNHYSHTPEQISQLRREKQ